MSNNNTTDLTKRAEELYEIVKPLNIFNSALNEHGKKNLINSGVSGLKKYQFNWIKDYYSNKNYKKEAENIEEVFSIVRDFEEQKNKLKNREINSYKLVSKIRNELEKSSNRQLKRNKREELSNEYEVVHEDDEYKIYFPYSVKASREIANRMGFGGVRWCTASEHTSNYFENYADGGSFLFYAISKNDKKDNTNKISICIKKNNPSQIVYHYNSTVKADNTNLSEKQLKEIFSNLDVIKPKLTEKVLNYKIHPFINYTNDQNIIAKHTSDIHKQLECVKNNNHQILINSNIHESVFDKIINNNLDAMLSYYYTKSEMTVGIEFLEENLFFKNIAINDNNLKIYNFIYCQINEKYNLLSDELKLRLLDNRLTCIPMLKASSKSENNEEIIRYCVDCLDKNEMQDILSEFIANDKKLLAQNKHRNNIIFANKNIYSLKKEIYINLFHFGEDKRFIPDDIQSKVISFIFNNKANKIIDDYYYIADLEKCVAKYEKLSIANFKKLFSHYLNSSKNNLRFLDYFINNVKMLDNDDFELLSTNLNAHEVFDIMIEKFELCTEDECNYQSFLAQLLTSIRDKAFKFDNINSYSNGSSNYYIETFAKFIRCNRQVGSHELIYELCLKFQSRNKIQLLSALADNVHINENIQIKLSSERSSKILETLALSHKSNVSMKAFEKLLASKDKNVISNLCMNASLSNKMLNEIKNKKFNNLTEIFINNYHSLRDQPSCVPIFDKISKTEMISFLQSDIEFLNSTFIYLPYYNKAYAKLAMKYHDTVIQEVISNVEKLHKNNPRFIAMFAKVYGSKISAEQQIFIINHFKDKSNAAITDFLININGNLRKEAFEFIKTNFKDNLGILKEAIINSNNVKSKINDINNIILNNRNAKASQLSDLINLDFFVNNVSKNAIVQIIRTGDSELIIDIINQLISNSKAIHRIYSIPLDQTRVLNSYRDITKINITLEGWVAITREILKLNNKYINSRVLLILFECISIFYPEHKKSNENHIKKLFNLINDSSLYIENAIVMPYITKENMLMRMLSIGLNSISEYISEVDITKITDNKEFITNFIQNSNYSSLKNFIILNKDKIDFNEYKELITDTSIHRLFN